MGGIEPAGSRCLVTGGAGTVGSAVVDALLEAGAARVTVLDDFSRGRRANLARAARLGGDRLAVVPGDIADRRLLARLTPGTDLLFHLAALRITQCAAEPRHALEVLVDGTFDVLEAAVAAGVRKVVFSSSASVYGAADAFPTPETQHLYRDDTLYGAAKAFGEGLLRSFHARDGLDYVALRYFNVYGPRMDVHGRYTEVLVRWLERIAAGRPPLILGDGTQTLDLVHTADVARANLRAAAADTTGTTCNIAGGTEVSLRDLADELLAAADATALGVEFGPARTVNGVPRRLADIARARAELGWSPRIPLRAGLRELVAWWRAERAAEAAAGPDTEHGGDGGTAR